MFNALTRQPKGAKLQTVSWQQHLKQYLLCQAQAIQNGLKHFWTSPIIGLLTLLSIGICLSFPTGLYLFMKNVQQMSQGWDQGAAISVYLKPASEQQIKALVLETQKYAFVKKAHYLSPEQALKEFQTLTHLEEAVALLPENPLPGLINIELKNQALPLATLEAMKEMLAKQPIVDEVVFDSEWVKKLNTLLAFGQKLMNALYGIIGLGVVFIVGNTLRLALERHKIEMQVLTMIGATTAYIRRPFLYRGILYGLFGGFVTLGILFIMTIYLQRPSEQIASLYQSIFVLKHLDLKETLYILGASTFLGWLGAQVAFGLQYREVRS